MAKRAVVKNSERVNVIVKRNENNFKGSIFAQTVIRSGGKAKLVPFRFKEGKRVKLPVEIIRHLASRKVYINSNIDENNPGLDKWGFVPEFTIREV